MKKIIITYGIIAGIIVGSMLLVTQPLFDKGILNYDNGVYVGYTTMIIAFSTIFVAVKTYRDKHNDGSITFGKGFKIGILITVIASLIYTLSWELYYNTAGHNFIEKYTSAYHERLKASGASEQEIASAMQQQQEFAESYKNPLVRMSFTFFMEIFPVGLIITLITALILRKKEVLPANTVTT